jgi:hypothetical protein
MEPFTPVLFVHSLRPPRSTTDLSDPFFLGLGEADAADPSLLGSGEADSSDPLSFGLDETVVSSPNTSCWAVDALPFRGYLTV